MAETVESGIGMQPSLLFDDANGKVYIWTVK